MVTAKTARIVVMVTATQPELWSWLQQSGQNCGHGYSKTARIVVMVTAKHTQESTVQIPDLVLAAISALA